MASLIHSWTRTQPNPHRQQTQGKQQTAGYKQNCSRFSNDNKMTKHPTTHWTIRFFWPLRHGPGALDNPVFLVLPAGGLARVRARLTLLGAVSPRSLAPIGPASAWLSQHELNSLSLIEDGFQWIEFVDIRLFCPPQNELFIYFLSAQNDGVSGFRVSAWFRVSYAETLNPKTRLFLAGRK